MFLSDICSPLTSNFDSPVQGRARFNLRAGRHRDGICRWRDNVDVARRHGIDLVGGGNLVGAGNLQVGLFTLSGRFIFRGR